MRRKDRSKIKALRRGKPDIAWVSLGVINWLSMGLIAAVCWVMARGRHTVVDKALLFLLVWVALLFSWLLSWRFFSGMVFSVEADEAGVTLESGLRGREPSKSTRQWGDLEEWHEDADHIGVFTHDRLFALVPKRAITATQVEELRGLLKSKVSEQPGTLGKVSA